VSAADLAAFFAVAACALAMVYAMVQWGSALLQAPLPPEGGSLLRAVLEDRAARRWGAIYAALWIALLGAFLALFAALGDRQPLRRLAFLLPVAAGWIGLSLAFVWLARALARVGQRAAVASRVPRPDAEPPSEEVGAAEAQAIAPPPPASRLRDTLGQAAGLAGVLLVIAVGQSLPPLRRLEVYLHLHQKACLVPLIALGSLGAVLFLGAAIAMVLAQGRPLSRRELEELERRLALLRQGGGWAAVRVPRLAVGAEAGEGASFAEIKTAFRLRAWEVSPRWRRMLSMMAGAALLVLGLFGVGIVIAPAGVKLLLAAAVLYAVVRTAVGFARA